MGKLNPRGLKALIERPGRYGDGQGLFFKTAGQGKAYWTYRYTFNGRDRETSIGPYPEVSLDEARVKHASLRAAVLAKTDPIAKRQTGKPAAKAGTPTFGAMADQHHQTHESGWRNAKHARQWRQTVVTYCAPIMNTPVDQVDTQAVLAVLKPLWARAPETGSRLRGRIEVVLDAAQALDHIDKDRANPARWRGHLERLLLLPLNAPLLHVVEIDDAGDQEALDRHLPRTS